MNTVNTIAYYQEGNYLLLDLVPPVLPKIGVWGMRRKDFLRKHHDGLYTGLLLSGKLNAHLEDVDRLAEEMLFHLVDKMARAESVTEQLKTKDQIAWVSTMNNIRARAEEVVYAELIYN